MSDVIGFGWSDDIITDIFVNRDFIIYIRPF